MWKKLHSLEVCAVRIHLAIIGYLTLTASSLFLGIVPWDDALLFDKIISTASLIFILQGIFAYRTDLPGKLKFMYFFTIIAFLYIHNNL